MVEVHLVAQVETGGTAEKSKQEDSKATEESGEKTEANTEVDKSKL